MKYQIYCNGELIGESNLESYDDGMNVHIGLFVPAPLYAKYQPLFRLYASAYYSDEHSPDDKLVEAYQTARDCLSFEVKEASGKTLDGTVHIVDFEGADMSIEILPK